VSLPRSAGPASQTITPTRKALFRTCKYGPTWPAKGFASIGDARLWVKSFAAWYNTKHHHSAIRFVTPEQRHRREDQALLAGRHTVYQAARERHPARWSGNTRNWQPVGSVWLNPERADTGDEGHGAADALTQKAGGGGPLAGRKTRAA